MRENNEDKTKRRPVAPFLAVLPVALLLVHCSLKLSFANVGVAEDGGATSDGSVSADGAPGADATTDAQPPSCKSTPGRGPTMVPVQLPNVPTFCIDTTEVSVAHYKAFLDDSTKPDAPSVCQGQDRHTKGGKFQFDAGRDMNAPIRYVDWCDAATFCAWAGKRLCGKPGGGASDFGGYNDRNLSEWYGGCTQKEEDYPYGNDFTEGTCNVDTSGDCVSAPTTFPACHGDITSLLGMTGNVKEWENSCRPDGQCRVRGGSCYNQSGDAICGADDRLRREGESQNNLSDVGFRCCSSF